jgi:hypothetical protein
MRLGYRKVIEIAIPLVISLSLSIVFAAQARRIASADSDNAKAFRSFVAGLEEYKQLRQEWRTRVLSNYLAGKLLRLVGVVARVPAEDAPIGRTASIWAAGWLMFVFSLYVAYFRQRSLLYILGTFCALSFAFTPGIGSTRVYPWDLPALFWYAVAVILLKSKRMLLLASLVPIGVLFKETALLIPVVFLFWEDVPWRRRLVLCTLSLSAGLAAKGIADLVTGSPIPLLTMTLSDPLKEPRLLRNLQLLFELRIDHPVFANSGLIAVLLLLPCSDRRILGWKVLAVLFIVGNMLFGVINEYRIWLELVPPSLHAIDLHIRSVLGSKPAALPLP